jgi:hypothetical protein
MPDWVSDLFKAIDEMDTDKFLSFLDEGCKFKFGNAPEATGKEEIKKAVTDFFGLIDGLKHNILKTWEFEGTIICQGEVTYTKKNDSQVTLPFANIFEMENNLVKNYMVYADIGPVFQ